MANEVSPLDFASVWNAVGGWPPDKRRALATRLLQSLEQDEPTPIATRLDDLRGLQNGWLDGKGIAPIQKELDWLASAFDRNYPNELPRPYLYPTPEGGIQAEWTLTDREI